MKKLLKIGAALLVLLIIAAAAAFLFLNQIVKSGVETVGTSVAKVPVKLDGAAISIFGGNGQLKGFFMGNPEAFKTAEAMRVGSISLGLDPGSLLAEKKIVRSIRVEAPQITYEAGFGGSNIGQILENIQAVAKGSASATNETEQAQTPIQVDDFLITGGQIHLSATMLGGKSVTLPLPDIHLTGLGQGPDGITAAELASVVFGKIVEATAKQVASSSLSIGKDVTESAKKAGEAAKDSLKKASSGLTDLFKAKSE